MSENAKEAERVGDEADIEAQGSKIKFYNILIKKFLVIGDLWLFFRMLLS